MKKLGILIGVLGLFALVGVASAATADELQPAQTITYDEELIVNATGRFDSVYIGSTEAGIGGVTFFNGTIVNASVDEDGEDTIPVTFGDDVRIDGEIYRTEVGGDNPIKLADSIRPQTTATYDLGLEDYQFNDAYFAGTVTVADLSAETLTLTGALTGTTATFSGDVTANSYTYGSAQTRYWSIGGAGFLPQRNTTAYFKTFDYLTSATGSFFAPVYLPDGAVVTSMEISYWDNQGAANAFVYLERYQKNGSSADVNMATVQSSGSSGAWETASNTSIDRATIDNSQYVYRLRAVMNNTNIRLSGVELSYTVTNPLP